MFAPIEDADAGFSRPTESNPSPSEEQPHYHARLSFAILNQDQSFREWLWSTLG